MTWRPSAFSAGDEHYEVVAIVSNDSDLVEAIRLVQDNLNLPIGLIPPTVMPGRRVSHRLSQVVSFIRPLRRGILGDCQLPSPIPGTRSVAAINSGTPKRPWGGDARPPLSPAGVVGRGVLMHVNLGTHVPIVNCGAKECGEPAAPSWFEFGVEAFSRSLADDPIRISARFRRASSFWSSVHPSVRGQGERSCRRYS